MKDQFAARLVDARAKELMAMAAPIYIALVQKHMPETDDAPNGSSPSMVLADTAVQCALALEFHCRTQAEDEIEDMDGLKFHDRVWGDGVVEIKRTKDQEPSK